MGSPQGDMHMAAIVAGCRNALVGTEWSNSRLGCANGHGKCYSYLVRASLSVDE